jgi:hypothetical protein
MASCTPLDPRIQLPVEQAAAIEVDQAFGLLIDEMAETRTLAGRKDDGFHWRCAPALEIRRRLGISGYAHRKRETA